MDLQKFILEFANEFAETPVSEFNENTIFKQIPEWDSVLALSIISMVDENYNKRISGNELRNCNTILELFETVKSI